MRFHNDLYEVFVSYGKGLRYLFDHGLNFLSAASSWYFADSRIHLNCGIAPGGQDIVDSYSLLQNYSTSLSPFNISYYSFPILSNYTNDFFPTRIGYLFRDVSGTDYLRGKVLPNFLITFVPTVAYITDENNKHPDYYILNLLMWINLGLYDSNRFYLSLLHSASTKKFISTEELYFNFYIDLSNFYTKTYNNYYTCVGISQQSNFFSSFSEHEDRAVELPHNISFLRYVTYLFDEGSNLKFPPPYMKGILLFPEKYYNNQPRAPISCISVASEAEFNSIYVDNFLKVFNFFKKLFSRASSPEYIHVFLDNTLAELGAIYN